VEKVIDFLELAKVRGYARRRAAVRLRKVVELGRALGDRSEASSPRRAVLGLEPEETDDMAFWIEDIQKNWGLPC
jgi:branched-chain amino acid transport system ATP-binding protein